jgi:hypothetical protein
MDPEEQPGIFDELTEEQKAKLLEVLELRTKFYRYAREMTRRQIELLRDPSPLAEEELKEFIAEFVTPVRREMAQKGVELSRDAIDIETMKSILPMILMAVTQGVNLPLLMTALGLDTDITIEAFGQIKKIIKGDS